MKIRMGFVSNSSSSSFVLVGKEITEASQLKKVKRLVCIGGWDSNEDVPFVFDATKFKDLVAKNLDKLQCFTLVDAVCYETSDIDPCTCKVEVSGKNIQVWGGVKTIHYPCDEKGFKEWIEEQGGRNEN